MDNKQSIIDQIRASKPGMVRRHHLSVQNLRADAINVLVDELIADGVLLETDKDNWLLVREDFKIDPNYAMYSADGRCIGMKGVHY